MRISLSSHLFNNVLNNMLILLNTFVSNLSKYIRSCSFACHKNNLVMKPYESGNGFGFIKMSFFLCVIYVKVISALCDIFGELHRRCFSMLFCDKEGSVFSCKIFFHDYI